MKQPCVPALSPLQRVRLLLLVGLVFVCVRPSSAAPWLPFGPFGGDARSFGIDPSNHEHLYLGTLNGWIYETQDRGTTWARVARLALRDDLALDHILVDPSNPKHLLVGVWVPGSKEGGLYSSMDGGKSWTENPDMKGESIRSMTESLSDSKVIVAGTLTGVYRSTDGGTHWKAISPLGSTEIHEVESIAIDPVNPAIIYAGTWHLPWKTVDGGEHWINIKEGIIDDSDVFSIIVDPKSPSTVYASACSGIYKSDDFAAKFRKIQGIPSTARRTRVLKQDPEQLATVFAGTTEGLFRTTDEGKTWNRTTGPEVIVNDVYVDPKNSRRVLLATDRGGVLASDDGGASFSPANKGFVARQVAAYAVDARNPATLYIGILNDKEWGGVFTSDNGGLTWIQQSTGLGGRDVFGLAQAVDGTFVAGTSHGIFRLKDSMWTQVGDFRETSAAAATVKSGSVAKRNSSARSVPTGARRRSTLPVAKGEAFDGGVYGLAADANLIFAVSTKGLMISPTSGESWSLLEGVPNGMYRSVTTAKNLVLAATLSSLVLSRDSGTTWTEIAKPDSLTQIAAVALDDEGDLWVGGREGLFVQRGGMEGWQNPPNLPIRDVNSLTYDRRTHQVIATANSTTTLIFAIHVPDFTTKSWDTGWHMRFVRVVGDHMVGATLYDGMVLQPQMIESPIPLGK